MMQTACHLAWPVTYPVVTYPLAPPDQLCARPDSAVAVVVFALFIVFCMAIGILAIGWAIAPTYGRGR